MSSSSGEGGRGDPMIGRVIGSRYRIEQKIGAGAMGSVYRARHVKIARAFAIKILHVDLLLEDSKLARRFVREAELAGTLAHPNIVKVTDVGETFEGLHYIAMEYAEGPTLGEIMATGGALPAQRVVALAAQLCDGLHHAHERGLIHRDFKPDNVIVETVQGGQEIARIVDFGIAVVRDDASSAQRERLTTAGITLGTPHYMAPEHVTGQTIDHRIDLFALGVVLYEALSGAMPFDGDGVDVARANLLEETPYMAKRAPHVRVDPLLEGFVRKLLAKAPDARPPTAKAAREILDLIVRDRARAAAALGILLPDAPPVTPPPVSRQVPRYGSHTPPTPFLAVPYPITYSPSGQHAIVELPPEGATPGEIADPTGPYVVETRSPRADSSQGRVMRPLSPSGSQRMRAARISQQAIPRPERAAESSQPPPLPSPPGPPIRGSQPEMPAPRTVAASNQPPMGSASGQYPAVGYTSDQHPAVGSASGQHPAVGSASGQHPASASGPAVTPAPSEPAATPPSSIEEPLEIAPRSGLGRHRLSIAIAMAIAAVLLGAVLALALR